MSRYHHLYHEIQCGEKLSSSGAEYDLVQVPPPGFMEGMWCGV
jgi:hypothetical protein